MAACSGLLFDQPVLSFNLRHVFELSVHECRGNIKPSLGVYVLHIGDTLYQMAGCAIVKSLSGCELEMPTNKCEKWDAVNKHHIYA